MSEPMVEWWEQPIEITQVEQVQKGAARRRIRMKAATWTVDVFPFGRAWSEDEPTIVIDGWLANDTFNTRLLVRMLKDALNYCEWGGVVEAPTANEIAALSVADAPAPDDAGSLPTNGPSLPNNAASLPTNAPDDAFADAVQDYTNALDSFWCLQNDRETTTQWVRQSRQRILAALHAAGYEIVQRDAPIQKPEPDWGRRGTQPKGTLGDPPPPNGKRVASKPLPPTPGPYNPFGKQDDV